MNFTDRDSKRDEEMEEMKLIEHCVSKIEQHLKRKPDSQKHQQQLEAMKEMIEVTKSSSINHLSF
ncbi:MAG: hypothetical protein AAF789_03210 [Bacteroidota bacterium]